MADDHGGAKASGRGWFRFYASVMNDPKVDRLPATLFKTWTKLMCLACLEETGKLPSIDDIAYHFRMSAQDAAQQVDELILAGLIDVDEVGNRRPHNWLERQFLSDSSSGRVRKHRAKKGETIRNVSGNVSRNADVTVSETPPDFRLQTSEEEKKDNFLLSAPNASRSEGKVQKSTFQNRRRKGEVEVKLKAIAEGLGFDVDAMVKKASEAKSPNAYFRELFKNEIRSLFPEAPLDFAEHVIAGDRQTLTAVYNLILERP
jgi:hypothetical protein